MEEEEDLSERGLPQIASIMSRVRDLKNKYRNEDNITDELNCTKISADTTVLRENFFLLFVLATFYSLLFFYQITLELLIE
uniref:Uncharacterized protein n=1 Tax=Pavo cristatus TaxID=9049 RepID=A0A8C9F677_PAVCR